ncbi:glycoside hydrolase family 43 protein [Flectobacillus rivi]|uniref:Glycoside hydrolase family 43 protein n=1 Tax=Flectobacillus rivi TaxID=2984209 RepID=A0ABT6Z7S0_9BACT|nr:glycoside hydrolase family 43 protein [Flectobacillus rivi]MDI9877187.1 glycoside hydrolase family 43 protein [Flectobacillus rivi]
MKIRFFLGLFVGMLLGLGTTSMAQNDVYLFSSFRDNGQDGLHLAYSYDGYNWTALKKDSSFLRPTVSKDKLMRDPCILKGPDGYFHMVWTVSWNDLGIGYARSKDLVHWSEQQFIPVMSHEPTALNCWAPEINYDAKTKEYLIYWATTIPDRFASTEGGKGDGKYNHRMYSTTTKDFKTFTPTRLFYDPGFNVIDVSIFQVSKKKYAMIMKDETKNPVKKNLKLALSKHLNSGFSPASEPISKLDWIEGPTVTKIGEDWVVYFDQYTRHKMGALKSKDLKNWVDISEEVHFPKGTRHGTVFKASKADVEFLLKQ